MATDLKAEKSDHLPCRSTYSRWGSSRVPLNFGVGLKSGQFQWVVVVVFLVLVAWLLRWLLRWLRPIVVLLLVLVGGLLQWPIFFLLSLQSPKAMRARRLDCQQTT